MVSFVVNEQAGVEDVVVDIPIQALVLLSRSSRFGCCYCPSGCATRGCSKRSAIPVSVRSPRTAARAGGGVGVGGGERFVIFRNRLEILFFPRGSRVRPCQGTMSRT